MRILYLRFQNLNSLMGEWTIDFSHPAFAAEGIFAITGPTGAGKSTILDAICLALFGRTPRLGNITLSANEIMSRHTGQCCAEVTFSCEEGVYRTHWHQHRAKNSPEGALQQPRHEIAEADTGKLLHGKKSDVPKAVERLTGMDFDRFTRSMLLAQGGFAAFLQASADERSPLLEQITGTEIYTRLSKMVHEKKSLAEAELKRRQEMLEGLAILDGEEEAALMLRREELGLKEKGLAVHMEKRRASLAWLQGIDVLKKELADLEQRRQALQRRKEAFSPEGARLARARKAHEYAPKYMQLEGLRKDCDASKNAYDNVVKALPALKEAEENAAARKTRSEKNLEEVRRNQAAVLALLRDVRVLDERINAKKEACEAAGREELAEKKRHDEAGERKRNMDAALKTCALELERCRKERSSRQGDAGLVEQFAGIKERVASLKALARRTQEKSGIASALEREGKKASQSLAGARDLFVQKTEALGLAEASHDRPAKALAVLLEGQTYEVFLEKAHAADLRVRHLLVLSGILDSLEGLAGKVRESKDLEKMLSEKQRDLTLARDGAASRRDATARERDLLENQLSLLARIASFEEERKRLRKGEACPLCGSLEHPLATDAEPDMDGAKTGLREANARLMSCQSEVQELEKTLAAVTADRQHTAKEIAAAEREAARLGAEAERSAKECSLKADGVLVRRELSAMQETHERVHAASRNAAALKAELERERQGLEEAKEAVALAGQAVMRAEAEEKRLDGEARAARQESDRLVGQMRDDLLNVEEDLLAPYGLTDLSPFSPFSEDRANRVLAALERRKEAWQMAQTRESGAVGEMEKITLQQENAVLQLDNAAAALAGKRDTVLRLREELERLQRDRHALLGDRDADGEERRQAGLVEAAGQALKDAEQALGAATQRYRDHLRDMDGEQKKLQSYAEQIAVTEPSFSALIAQAGFADEDDYKAASLPVEERERLAQEERSLVTEGIEIASLQQEKSARLAEEEAKSLTVESDEIVAASMRSLDDELASLRNELGRLDERITTNEANKEQQKARRQALSGVEREADRWRGLHVLIGSADGKKFRNFAQGLTFEIMVAHANMQLRKMTDRYLLARAKDAPLELNVIDNYQAGEERSTRNLSGGESFIVSLALALGLSGMSSGSMRVDSLFLDEGFGALDEDALETALDTLAGLRREGKLIGVISHVGALKERIGLQIEVRPVQGGKSVLSGPGCAGKA